MGKLNLEIVTPTRTIASVEIDELSIPAHWGQMGIFPLHADFITTLSSGELSYRSGTSREKLNIIGGLFSVSGSKATVLADGVLADVIDLNAAIAAKKKKS